METFELGDDFLLGTATSATQIEGGDTNNTWYRWCKQGHIKDGSSCYTACDHWNRVAQDTELLRELHVSTHRMSLEWSRIEPEEGRFSQEALAHYRDEIERLVKSGIRPLVTLHHFSEPLWFAEKGGWLKKENTACFTGYVRFVVENLGDLVSDWITFNEPNVYAFFGYGIGLWPPGMHNISACRRVLVQMIRTHAELYGLIHKIRAAYQFPGRTKVGAAIHVRIFEGLTGAGKLTAEAIDYAMNVLAMEGMTTGRLLFPLAVGESRQSGTYADFLGLNYYSRNIVEFALDPSNYFHRLINDKDLDKTDLGWDIYPRGIYQVCKRFFTRYHLPIFITENGISDHLDNRRPDFIVNHLRYLNRAQREGVRIERYYHWSLMDNFEWLDGQTGNFGLYHCDFPTQVRTPRPSAALYAQICKEKAFTRQMADAFVAADRNLPGHSV